MPYRNGIIEAIGDPADQAQRASEETGWMIGKADFMKYGQSVKTARSVVSAMRSMQGGSSR